MKLADRLKQGPISMIDFENFFYIPSQTENLLNHVSSNQKCVSFSAHMTVVPIDSNEMTEYVSPAFQLHPDISLCSKT